MADTAAQLRSTARGFDRMFHNDFAGARQVFGADDQESPFHAFGLGICGSLEAIMRMEPCLIAEALKSLSHAEAEAKKRAKSEKKKAAAHRFPTAIEWELLHADAIIILGLIDAMSQSFGGLMQCLYFLNSAYSKLSKLHKVVFPAGLSVYPTPEQTSEPAHVGNGASVAVASSPSKSGVFGWWSRGSTPIVDTSTNDELEEFIVSGVAFGIGIFNLGFSFLPPNLKTVVGFFGYGYDRKLALQALAVSAARSDAHSIFAGLVLMTYQAFALDVGSYYADEERTLKQYRAILDNIESRYPSDVLWVWHRAKLLSLSRDPEACICACRGGLKSSNLHTFAHGELLFMTELAWTLLSQSQYQEAGDTFIKLIKHNRWSQTVYSFMAAGCYFSMGRYEEAQKLLNTVLHRLSNRSGRMLPVEVFIRKKLDFYKQKQVRRGGQEKDYVRAIKISPVDEMAVIWNCYSRIGMPLARSHIDKWSAFSPAVEITSPLIAVSQSAAPVDGVANDLDTPDELALRSLLLGVVHRTAGHHDVARAFFDDARQRQPDVQTSTWIGGVALYELAVLDLMELAAGAVQDKDVWREALKSASERLDEAVKMAHRVSADLIADLDTVVAMLRDEIALKNDALEKQD